MAERFTYPMVESSMWVASSAGPIAREALEAIGHAYSGGNLKIEFTGERITLNGQRVTEPDAWLVRAAWYCDPHPFMAEPTDQLVNITRKAIETRRDLSRLLRHMTIAMRRMRE